MHTVVNNRTGPKNYLIKDEEAYIVVESEMEGEHRLPIDTTGLVSDIKQVIHGIGKMIIVNEIKNKLCTKVCI